VASLRVEFKAAASAHIEEACEFYSEKASVRLAAKFLQSVDRAVRQLGEFPLSCPEFAYGARRKRLDGFPYWIYHRFSTDRVDVLAGLHSKRSPGLHRKNSH
jgi:plasmid stabilization system protein ParE